MLVYILNHYTTVQCKMYFYQFICVYSCFAHFLVSIQVTFSVIFAHRPMHFEVSLCYVEGCM